MTELAKPYRRRRMRLRRYDGQVFLDRWGIEHDRIGGVFLHKMSAPDPGKDLHDHPWSWVSIVLWGGYTEERAPTREAPVMAEIAARWPDTSGPGAEGHRSWLSVRSLRLDECHRITALDRRTCWTLLVHGPRQRSWGFYLPTGWVDERTYDDTVRVDRRDLWNEEVRRG